MEGSGEMGSSYTPIISGLPDDIALFCLARVPRRYHHVLKCVSRRWRALVCGETWHLYRREHNLDEAWVYALCRDNEGRACFYLLDAERRCWKPFQGVLPQFLKRKGIACEALGKKLYLLGGCRLSEDASDEVYCYDASTNSWEEAAPLKIARCYCICQALNGRLYAIGGMGSGSNLCSWDTYDPNSNSWTTHSNSSVFPEIEDSVALDEKLYILCGEKVYNPRAMSFRRGTSLISPKPEVLAYDPSEDVWQKIDNNMVSGWCGPAVVVDGTLYVLDQNSGTKLMMWEAESKDWVAVGRLSTWLTRPPCHLVAVGRTIFVIGMGLSTVVIDLNMVANVDGMMVCYSIPKLDCNVDVISCKALAI